MPRRNWYHRTRVGKRYGVWFWGCQHSTCTVQTAPDWATAYRRAEYHTFLGGYHL